MNHTEYGSWEQYRERVEEAIALNQGGAGINCPHLSGCTICAPCALLKQEWRLQNGLGKEGERIRPKDHGIRMAGL